MNVENRAQGIVLLVVDHARTGVSIASVKRNVERTVHLAWSPVFGAVSTIDVLDYVLNPVTALHAMPLVTSNFLVNTHASVCVGSPALKSVEYAIKMKSLRYSLDLRTKKMRVL